MWAAIAKAKKDIPLEGRIIPKGTVITITKGLEFEYALWTSPYIWDLPKEYIGEIVKILSED